MKTIENKIKKDKNKIFHFLEKVGQTIHRTKFL
jgi:hypothetical protein